MISQQLNKNKKWLIPAAIALVLAIFAITSYNSLTKQDEQVSNGFNNLQAAYQRRTDLIPNLVNVVQAAAGFEKTTLEQLATIRSQAASMQLGPDVSGEAYKQLEQTQGELANTMNRVLAVIERYPELKSQTAFLRLQDQIKGTENRIRIARIDLNKTVTDYNVKVRSFPRSMFAGLFGFKRKSGFQSEAEAAQAPAVKF